MAAVGTIFHLRVLTFFLIFLITALAQESDHASCGPPQSSHNYPWEKYDYYKILGLEGEKADASRTKREKARGAIDSQQIRKAYRKQAQKYHPDKARTNSTMSVDERNDRFARIAEAYEILNDEEKRQDYDRWLLDCEDSISGQSRTQDARNEWSVFDSFSDPRRVFEEFFFNADGSWDEFSGTKRNLQHPVRVYETEEVLFDRFRGQEVLRVFRTEEFLPDKDGSYFYRVISQDFVEHLNRIYGLEYQPISPPVIVEQGRRERTRLREHRENTDMLSSHEFMTQQSPPLVSSNGLFYAGLSPECELIVALDASEYSDDVDDSLIWTSGTFVPQTAQGCFVSIQGPYLVLSLGSPDHPGQVLWNSEIPDGFDTDEDPAPVFFVSLDDDGSLVVYSQKTTLRDSSSASDEDFDLSSDRAHIAWKKVKSWTKQTLSKADPRFRKNFNTHPPFITETVCIFATGPAGCNASGRRLIQFAHRVRKSVSQTLVRIDSAFDSFVEFLQDEEDEDVLDTLSRIFGHAGSSISKAGAALARKGARMIHNKFQE
jgi:curved DNA-binding protein CbpA